MGRAEIGVSFSGESQLKRRARLAKIISALNRAYPDAHCELTHSNPLELLVATILSAQCTDKQVNLATANLFRKYPTAADYARASLLDLERLIRRLGLYRHKARNIRSCCQQITELHGGEVPPAMDPLVALAGVGRKTANVVLGNGFGIHHGIAVDTHVRRLSRRLGLTRQHAPEQIEMALQKLVPRSHWIMISHWLIWHGRRRCPARHPDCAGCEIRRYCPSAMKCQSASAK